MSLSGEARRRLGEQQAQVVGALLGRGEVHVDIDAVRLDAAAAALQRKRIRGVARAWRDLARALGPQFGSLFAAYTATENLPRDGGPLADGRRFAAWLAARNDLPDAGKLQALIVDLRFATRPNGLSVRRWPTYKATRLHESRRVAIGVNFPWLGALWCSFPIAFRRPV